LSVSATSFSTAISSSDSGGVKLIHFGGLKLTHPYVQWPPV
jgi:hypothetical protein